MAPRIPQATRDAAVKLYAEGLTGEAVAERLFVSAESVRTWVRAAGLEVRRGGAARMTRTMPAVDEDALKGGHWVPRKGIQRWELAS